MRYIEKYLKHNEEVEALTHQRSKIYEFETTSKRHLPPMS